VIYRDDRDRQHFVDLLGEVHERFRIRIHAYSLMSTHWHGVLQTPDANLSAAMQWLHLSHAAWYNARHDRIGPLWQGRFRATPIEDGLWAYEVSLYVHLNPVSTEEFGLGKQSKKTEAAGFREPSKEEVSNRLRQLREYGWSSYRSYGGYEKGPEWLETDILLGRASVKKENRRKKYRDDAKLRLSKGVDESKNEKLRDAVAIGGEHFVRRVKSLAKGGGREVAGKRELRRRLTFEEVVGAIEKLKGSAWTEIVSTRGDWGRPLAMWAARRYCGLTLREIGAHFDDLDYAAVSIALKRFEKRAATSHELRSQVNQLTQRLNVET